MEKLIEEIDKLNIEYIENELLSNHSSFKIGGPARILAKPSGADQIQSLVELARRFGIPYLVLGNGSNVLFDDRGYRGLVIKLGKNFSAYKIEGNQVWAQAGALLSKVCKKAARKNLKGVEFGTGIPGSVGGGVVMNAGAYDGELKDVIRRVKVLDEDGHIITYTNEEMRFGYRTSRVYEEHLIVLEMEMELEQGEEKEIWDKIDDFTSRRWTKQPIDLPSAGSTFKRPPGRYAGQLIQEAGCKGLRFRDAQVSDKHSGFIVNRGQASGEDVRTLIRLVQKRVRDQFGIELEPEVKIIGTGDED